VLDVEPLEVPPVADELVSLEAAGAVVELELVEGAVEGAGAGAVDDGAGAGVTTVSSFLQAARPTAMQAARRRSERFMFFPLETTEVRLSRTAIGPASRGVPNRHRLYQLRCRACGLAGAHRPAMLAGV
jgi:hypothetical protein